MTSKRLHLILLVTIGLQVIALLGGAYGINKLLTRQATTLTSAKAKSAALQQEQIGLKKAKQDVVTYADLEKITRTIVPEDKTQAEAVREIVNIAGANGISLGSITFPASTLGNSATPAAAGSAKPVSTPVATPVTTNSKTDKLSQLLPVPNIPGVYGLTITVQSDNDKPVAYSKFVSFLSGLENNRRTAQVSTINLTPSKTNRNLISFTLTINEYIKP